MDRGSIRIRKRVRSSGGKGKNDGVGQETKSPLSPRRSLRRDVSCVLFVVAALLVAFVLSTFGGQLINLDTFSLTSSANSVTSERFPLVGTPAFVNRCPWTHEHYRRREQTNCTLFFRPIASDNEGLAYWVSRTVQGSLKAILSGCRLLVDYGTVVQLDQVLMAPFVTENWTVPKDFVCQSMKSCRNVNHGHLGVPDYRHVYKNISTLNINRTRFRHLKESLPGFDVEIGFACSFNSIFQLAPAAAQFQPNLFTELLPTLRNPHNLVLAVYVRTGFTDQAARAEKNGTTAIDKTRLHGAKASTPFACAQKLEQTFLEKGNFQNIVWMLVTDSQSVKHHVSEKYHEGNCTTADGKAIPRIVLTTGSRGIHSRPARDPSTVDFAESMIDWYLIGESDAVVINNRGYTFATTGAMRTNRSVYDSSRACSEMSWLQ